MISSARRGLALLFARTELPGWGRVMQFGQITHEYQEEWVDAPMVTVKGKSHRYLMKLNLADQLERRIYYMGRFQELATERTLRYGVHQGDTVLDIGANMGMVTLIASRRVGQPGHVHAFEPNPAEATRLRELIELNGIHNIELHEVALGDTESEMRLALIDGSSQYGTLASPSESETAPKEYMVRVVRGDDMFAGSLSGPLLIKIDTEGFECRVLDGLRAIIEQYQPLVITEVDEQALARGGFRAEDLIGRMKEREFRGYAMTTRRTPIRHELALRAFDDADDLRRKRSAATDERNVAWIKPGSVHEQRLSRFLE